MAIKGAESLSLISKCQVSSERRVLDLESEAWVQYSLDSLPCPFLFPATGIFCEVTTRVARLHTKLIPRH